MNTLTKTEQAAYSLIKADLQFLLTVIRNETISSPSYLVALLPYIGMIIDGCESWSQKVKWLPSDVPSFTEEEKQFYTELRHTIKLWETSFSNLVGLLNQKYNESEIYFSGLCKPIAKRMKWYDVFGVYLIDGIFCDNTVLDTLFVPRYHFNHIDGAYLRAMTEVGGKIITRFGITEAHVSPVNCSISFDTKDFGGFTQSPIGNKFTEKFVLFSMLCAINFILYGIDKYIAAETTTKLRLAYIQYYYLAQQLPALNSELGTSFHIDLHWVNTQFRNCMAHYGLGSVLAQDDIIETDSFGGLTEKLFYQTWVAVKDSIIDELHKLSEQFSTYLKL